jgi:diguanylate cyclase (GGDEF)-like protein/PAS domain S-box-containing protein
MAFEGPYGMASDEQDSRSIARILSPLLVALVLTLGVAVFSLEVLSTIRAYVGGESMYSKGQKNATYYLTQYATTRLEADYQRYQVGLNFPLGDRRARIALQQEPPDYDAARAGLIDGGNNAADVPSMIRMFRWFGGFGPMRTAIDIWTRGDAYTLRISALGEQLHQSVAAGQLSGPEQRALLLELQLINEQLTTLESQFSNTLGAAARLTRTALAITLLLASIVMGVLAVGVTRVRLRERERFEATLQASEERYRSVFESSMDAVLVTLPSGRVLDANPEACRLFGYTPDEIRALGRQAIIAENSEALDLALAQRQKSGRFKSHLQFRRRDGRTFTGEACLATFTDHLGEPRISTVIRDVTGQQRYERGLARLTALYAAQSQTSQLIVRVSHQRLLFDELCRICVNAGGLSLAAVGLLDAEKGRVNYISSHGAAKHAIDEISVALDASQPTDLESATAAISEGQPQVRNHVDLELPSRSGAVADANVLFRSTASLPLRCLGKMIGVLSVFSVEPQFFDRDIIDLLRQIAGEVSFALDNLHREEERQLRETLLADQNRVLSMVASGAEISLILATVTQLLESQSAGAVCTLVMLDQKGTQYSAGVAPSLPEGYDKAVLRVALEDALGPCAEAMRTRNQISVEYLDDYTLDAPLREFVREAGLKSVRAWPIIGNRDQLLGGIALYGRIAGRVVAVDDNVLRNCTDLAGIAIENRTAAERIQHLAHHDEVTGLPNRILFSQHLSRALARAKRSRAHVGVLFLDLDRFKNINDTLGHGAGDKALAEIAHRLRTSLRESDSLARVGGDEFTALIEGFSNPQVLADVAQKILSVTARTLIINGHECHLSGSIGIAIFPEDGADNAALLKNADIAMYRAKNAGRDQFQFYSEEMNEHSLERLALETELRHAIARREFEVHYQPKVDVHSGEITGAEGLVRWRHPERGMLAPGTFIGIAEETGLIGAIGRQVVGSDAKRWRDAGVAPLRIAVNLSGHQCEDPRLLGDLDRIFTDAQIDPGWFEFEITESVVMHSMDAALQVLNQLKTRGITLAIDDFGTGHSSLAYIKRFPIDTLKIDRTFIRDISVDQNDLAITRAIIAMGHSLGLKITAEGVETEEQLDILRRFDCDEYQGFLFSKPVPAAEFEDMRRREPVAQGERVTRRA